MNNTSSEHTSNTNPFLYKDFEALKALHQQYGSQQVKDGMQRLLEIFGKHSSIFSCSLAAKEAKQTP